MLRPVSWPLHMRAFSVAYEAQKRKSARHVEEKRRLKRVWTKSKKKHSDLFVAKYTRVYTFFGV